MPEMGGQMRMRVPSGSLFLLPYTVKKVDFGPEEEDGGGGEGGAIKLCHNLENSRALHMMGAGAEEEDEEEDGVGEGGDCDGSGSESEEGANDAPQAEDAEEADDDDEAPPMFDGDDDEEEMGEEGVEKEEEEAPQHPLDAIPGMIFPAKFRPAVALLAQGKVRGWVDGCIGRWEPVGHD